VVVLRPAMSEQMNRKDLKYERQGEWVTLWRVKGTISSHSFILTLNEYFLKVAEKATVLNTDAKWSIRKVLCSQLTAFQWRKRNCKYVSKYFQGEILCQKNTKVDIKWKESNR
jgi:hypothetical protein